MRQFYDFAKPDKLIYLKKKIQSSAFIVSTPRSSAIRVKSLSSNEPSSTDRTYVEKEPVFRQINAKDRPPVAEAAGNKMESDRSDIYTATTPIKPTMRWRKTRGNLPRKTPSTAHLSHLTFFRRVTKSVDRSSLRPRLVFELSLSVRRLFSVVVFKNFHDDSRVRKPHYKR